MRTLDALVEEVVERFVLAQVHRAVESCAPKAVPVKDRFRHYGQVQPASTLNVIDGAYFGFDLEESAV
jgi:hypothetical protein